MKNDTEYLESIPGMVDSITNASKEELSNCSKSLGWDITEIERKRILQAHEESIEEYKSGKLKFNSDFNELISRLNKK
jgi:hypothetical protein